MIPSYWQLLSGLVAAGLFSFLTIRRGSLTPDGAAAASFCGLWVLFFAGPLWLLPLFFFFISSTLLGRLTKRRSPASDAKHGKARDYRQVLCNGGMYAFLATFACLPDQDWPPAAMAVSIAVSTADTWSSETGIFCRGRTVDILRGKTAPVGLSGGVSWQGSAGGLAGAFCIAVWGSYLLYGYFSGIFTGIVTGLGFAGMAFDSLLGAAFQARYRDPASGLLSDMPVRGAALHSGFGWMSNDGVNLLSNAVVSAVAVYYFWCN